LLGDLSGVPASPTPWTLEAGPNLLAGSAGVNATLAAVDYDLIAFEVPAGHQLQSIDVTAYEGEDPFALAFFGLQAGSPWLDGVGFIGGESLMGWAHIDSSMTGVDLLQEIRSHANDPVFGVPLGSGVYTMLIQDIDTMFDYALTFNVSTVPEPSSMALTAVGLAACCYGARGRRRG
jgi:hypothetical protein